jgi:hypothetical protein
MKSSTKIQSRGELLLQLSSTVDDLARWAHDMGDEEAACVIRQLSRLGLRCLERRLLPHEKPDLVLAPLPTEVAIPLAHPLEVAQEGLEFLELNRQVLCPKERSAIGIGLMAEVLFYQRVYVRDDVSTGLFRRLRRLDVSPVSGSNDTLQELLDVGQVALAKAQERISNRLLVRRPAKTRRRVETKRVVSEQVQAALNGKRIFVVGGVPQPERILEMERAFGATIVWNELAKGSSVEKHLADAQSCDINVVLIRWVSHATSAKMMELARSGDIRGLVLIPCGFSVSQLAHELEGQLLRKHEVAR